MTETFKQRPKGMIEDWEWKLVADREGFRTCKKCGYEKAILQSGAIYCNECGILEDIFASVDLSRKSRN